MVALFWLFLHLTTHVDYRNLRDEQLLTLSLTPSLLGGLPIIYLHNFHTRAESDYLAPILDLIKFLELISPLVSKIMKNFLDFDLINIHISIETLLRDLYALPIERPPQPASILRSTFKTLLPIIKNEEVKDFIEWTNQFVRCLTSSDVYQPRFLSAIYS